MTKASVSVDCYIQFLQSFQHRSIRSNHLMLFRLLPICCRWNIRDPEEFRTTCL